MTLLGERTPMDTVCILCRQIGPDTEQYGLVLGVFPTPRHAMVHASVVENVSLSERLP
jgi:hypothetical protein